LVELLGEGYCHDRKGA
jgi:hypothetical protein